MHVGDNYALLVPGNHEVLIKVGSTPLVQLNMAFMPTWQAT